jgi:hypothetical protein
MGMLKCSIPRIFAIEAKILIRSQYGMVKQIHRQNLQAIATYYNIEEKEIGDKMFLL